MLSAYYYKCTFWQNCSKVILAIFWTSGIVFGVSAARAAGDVLFLLMRRLLVQPMSIDGLLVQFFVSFLITILAVILSKPWLLSAAAFVKAFFLAFLLESIMIYYSCAAGLLHILFYCNAFYSAGFLLWFWFRHISGFRIFVLRDLFLCFTMYIIGEFIVFYFWGIQCA